MAKAPVGKKRPSTTGTGPSVARPVRPRSQGSRPPALQPRAEAARRKRVRMVYAATASALVVVLIVVLIIVKLAGGTSKATSVSAGSGNGVGPATPASVTSALASIPPGRLAQAAAAAGSGANPPSAIGGTPLGGAGRPPGVLYIGAGYCPYCAAERWALVTALLQFGTFAGLSDSHSSAADINPSTPTFNFHGSTYSSRYVSFTAVEETTSDPRVRLDTPTPSQQALIERYTGGTIPFVDFDGRYVITGAQYDGKILAGLSVEQVATQAADPSTPIGRAVQATAGTIVRTLCRLTGGQPGNVCGAFPSGGA